MKPTLGRIVHYTIAPGQVRAADVVHVYNDTCVELLVKSRFSDGGPSVRSVDSVVEGGPDKVGTWF